MQTLQPYLGAYLLVLVILASVCWFLPAHLRRKRQIQALAARLRFNYLGSALPKTLSVVGTELQKISKVWNACDGQFRGAWALFFDCRIGEGKSSWRRTVLALQTDDWRELGFQVPQRFTVIQSGKWQIFVESRGGLPIGPSLISTNELEDYFGGPGTHA